MLLNEFVGSETLYVYTDESEFMKGYDDPSVLNYENCLQYYPEDGKMVSNLENIPEFETISNRPVKNYRRKFYNVIAILI